MSTPRCASWLARWSRAWVSLGACLVAGGAVPPSLAPGDSGDKPSASVPEYAAAAVTLPADVTAPVALKTWHGLMVERGLDPEPTDETRHVVLGRWLSRPHVCRGWVRYHLALSPGKALRALVVAECAGQGVSLDRAGTGLADELGKRLSAPEPAATVPVQDVPARLWQSRLWSNKNTPPSPPSLDGGGAPRGSQGGTG
jgi:hypothetical protein